MNWLAHVFLSEPDVECRLGNLLADLVKGRARQGMSAQFLRGVACHQVIDAFTDFHPVIQRRKARLSREYEHLTGILIDVFCDYFLARNWSRYAAEPLEAFTAAFYEALQAHPIALPEAARVAVERMIADDRLGSYRHLGGIEATLRKVSARLSARLHRPFALESAISELVAHSDELEGDFVEFFPELRAHVARWHTGTASAE